MYRRAHALIVAALLVAAGGCSVPNDDLCSQATEHVRKLIVFRPAGASGTAEDAIEPDVRFLSQETCRSEGLSREQADCILAARTFAQVMALGECPAIREKRPNWLPLPPNPEEREPNAPEEPRSVRRFPARADSGGSMPAPDAPDGPRESVLRFRALAGSGGGTCGLRGDGELQCWGSPEILPQGPFTKIDNARRLCGLDLSGRLLCGDSIEGDDLSYLPKEPLSDFDEGPFHGCGVRRSDGSLTCWSLHAKDAVTPPVGRFIAVVSGDGYSCALAEDGDVRCFGSKALTTAPEGTFRALTGGPSGACGLREDGTLHCWDERAFGPPPAGSFKDLSCGDWHCCAIRADDTLVCWGSNAHGRASPPGGGFSDVMAAADHSCGIRAEGGVVCWGSNHLGQCNVPQREGDHNWY